MNIEKKLQDNGAEGEEIEGIDYLVGSIDGIPYTVHISEKSKNKVRRRLSVTSRQFLMGRQLSK